MPDLYLIAHKVRGEAALDIAQQMECPLCVGDTIKCVECDSLGYWWIIPTSGHRAYPYWHQPLDTLIDWELVRIFGRAIPDMPEELQDHYHHSAAPSRLDQLKAMLPPVKSTPIHRRF